MGSRTSFRGIHAAIAFTLASICATLPLGAQEAPPADAGLPASAGAGPVASDGEASPPGLLEAALERERRIAQEDLDALAAFSRDLDRQRQESRTWIQSAQNRVATLAAALRSAEPRAPEIENLYEEILSELMEARSRLRGALGAVEADPALPPAPEASMLNALEAPAIAGQVAEVERMREEARQLRSELRARERQMRWTALEMLTALGNRLDELRTEALDQLPPARQGRELGLTREGIDLLEKEIQQLRLLGHLYILRARAGFTEIPAELTDVFVVGAATWTGLKVLAILAAALLLWQRRAAIRAAIRRRIRRPAFNLGREARAAALFDILDAVAPWGLLLLVIWGLRWATSGAALRAEIDLALHLAFLYGVYRLSIAGLYAAAIVAARQYRLRLDEGNAAQWLGSARALMRAVMGIVVLLALSERLLGRGFLYHMVVRLSWVVFLITAFVLLARWRRVIADAYLNMTGPKPLASVVKGARDRWYGVFVAVPALIFLALHAAATVGRDFAMGFDQTRRALAFLFRHRAAKRAERQGYADGSLEDLPPELLAAFQEDPSEDPRLAVDRFPGMDVLERMLTEWREGETGASYLLSGEKGVGKTTWLRTIDPDGLPVTRLTIASRVATPARLASLLGRELEIELEGEAVLPAVQKSLLAGEKRIVVVDLLQDLFLGRVGGYDTFEAFASLVEATCGQVFWICGISAFACDHLFAVRPDLQVFRHHQTLEPWSEEEVGTLIRTRLEACGVQPSFRDLLAQGTYGSEARALEERTREEFIRLLWDYANGNPRSALHFWLRSLVAGPNGQVRVRLFRPPPPEELEALGDSSRFLMAAIVVHENLSLQEAVAVTRYPAATCRIHLDRLEDKGILRRDQGRYRLTAQWHQAVIRFLKRGNLLSD